MSTTTIKTPPPTKCKRHFIFQGRKIVKSFLHKINSKFLEVSAKIFIQKSLRTIRRKSWVITLIRSKIVMRLINIEKTTKHLECKDAGFCIIWTRIYLSTLLRTERNNFLHSSIFFLFKTFYILFKNIIILVLVILLWKCWKLFLICRFFLKFFWKKF